jgi:hypothetical protein
MRIKYKILLVRLAFFFSVIIGNNTEKDAIVDLSVYDGQGGLLIEWFAPGSIQVKEVKVLRKKIGESNFILLSTFPYNIGRYLDKGCLEDTRYYYKIEITQNNGTVITSDVKRPSFGTCLESQNGIVKNIKIKSLRSLIIFDLLNSLDNSKLDNQKKSLSILLNSILEKKTVNWIENFPLKYLKESAPLINHFSLLLGEYPAVERAIKYQPIFSNTMLLTPTEWISNFSNEIITLQNEWILLEAAYPQAINYFDKIDPMKIVKCSYDQDHKPVVNLFFFHPEKLINKELFFLHDDQYIEIDISKISNERNQEVKIPEYWDHISLMMNDTLIEKYDLIKNKNIIYTLKGELIPALDVKSPFIKVEREYSDLRINEVQWNNLTQKLNLELTYDLKPTDHYSVSCSSQNLWELKSETDFKNNFIDSSFNIGSFGLESKVIAINIIEKSQNRALEYIVLNELSFLRARNEELKWSQVDKETFGRSNKESNLNYDSSLVPELFVLYQNYPNPFNGQTRIAFDLLGDAVVSLFVADATGRIHNKILEKEFITSGSYTFLWNGDKRSTGIYFITLQAQVDELPPAIISRKMIYLK